jgi:hypothetical protein
MSNKNRKALISMVIITIFIISNISISFAVEHNQSSTGNHTSDQGTNNSGSSSANKSTSGQGTSGGQGTGTDGGSKKPSQPITTPTNDTGTNQTEEDILSPAEEAGAVVLGAIIRLLEKKRSIGWKVLASQAVAGNVNIDITTLLTPAQADILYKKIDTYLNILVLLLLALIPYIP